MNRYTHAYKQNFPEIMRNSELELSTCVVKEKQGRMYTNIFETYSLNVMANNSQPPLHDTCTKLVNG